jgi:predicted dehydrogenase
MSKPRLAVVGTGHLGSIHAKLYREIENCELVAVCDLNEERLTRVSKELGVAGYTDYKELFDKVDAVSIAAPTSSHHRIAYEFLSRKIHTLVEKPFTTDLKEADSLIRLAKKNKLILQVGHVERFNSAFSAVRKLIRAPKFIECHRLSQFPNRSLDIGVVLDLMIHDIDIVLGLVESPLKKVEAVGLAVLTGFEDIANVRLTFKDGCVCNLTASRISDDPMRKIRIFLNNAYISLDYKNEQASIYRKNPGGITKDDLPIEKEQPLKKELSSFVECVITGQPPLVTGETARQALALALDIRKIIWKK